MSDDIAKRLPHKYYSEQELKEMKRLDIRFIATERYGMDTKQCSKTSTADVLAYIMEKQEEEFGKGGKGGKAAPKGKAAPAGKVAPKGRVKEPEPEPEPEEAEPEEEEVEEAVGGDTDTKLDGIGVAMDSGFGEVKEALESIASALLHVQKQQFVLLGLVEGLFMANEGEDGLNERKTELEEAWEQEGNG